MSSAFLPTDSVALDRAVRRLAESRVQLPQLAQLANPALIPTDILTTTESVAAAKPSPVPR